MRIMAMIRLNLSSSSGEHPEWVARQMGHSNTEMLFKVYPKYVPNLTRNDGSAFKKFLGCKLEEREKNKGREGGGIVSLRNRPYIGSSEFM